MGRFLFRYFKIRNKIMVSIAVAVLLSAAAVGGYSIYQTVNRFQRDIAEVERDQMLSAQNEMKDLVNTAYTVLEKAHAQSTTMESIQHIYGENLQSMVDLALAIIKTEYERAEKDPSRMAEAQKRALEAVALLRYGASGYFWVNDTQPKMLMHPILPELNGKDVGRYSQGGRVIMAEGTDRPMFEEFVRVASTSPTDGGFVSYLWPHPQEKKWWARKLSYVRLFKPWGWVIGTGVYVDRAEIEAKKRALETLSGMRYGDQGYFWANDTFPRMVMHPLLTKRIGEDVTHFLANGKELLADGTGRPIFQEFVRVAQESPNGVGFVRYNGPDTKNPDLWVPKISCVRLFKPWNLVVGTGVYLDRVEKAVAEKRQELTSAVRGQVIFLGAATVGLMFLAFLLAFYVSRRYIERPIQRAVMFAEALGAGEYDKRLHLNHSRDEITRLGNALDKMADDIQGHIEQLDAKVWARTQELNEKNESLSAEIEERVRMEAELIRARDSAEAANHAKSEFLARMSHEIRTPMNAILGMAELLQETDLTKEQEEYVETFSISGELLLGIINDILDFSKIEAEQIEFESIPFDMSELVEDTCRLLGLRAHEKGIELVGRVEPAVHLARIGDPTRLRQVLINFLGNAIKFTHEGEVVLTVENDPTQAEGLIFTVRDTGIGIPADKLETIFESFSQADTSTTRKYGGTGLGLAINKKLIELLGGTVDVQSAPNQGTTFTIRLHYEKSRVVPKAFSAALSELKGLRVLVVDDNATNRTIFYENLTRWGADVTVVESGQKAITEVNRSLAENRPYQLAMVDCNMPEMDGFQLTQALQAAGTAPPCLMMFSSSDTADIKSQARNLGVTQHLTKPIRQADMQAAILAALGKVGLAGMDREMPASLNIRRVALPPMRILLVEDYQPNRNIVQSFLKGSAVQVEIAENGQVAVDKFKAGSYHVVLMDMEMPVMDGLAATRLIRDWEKVQRRSATPIVALTAHVFSEHRTQCAEAGCNGFLAKPIKKKTLLEMLWKHAPEATLEPSGVQPAAAVAKTPVEEKHKSFTVLVDDDLMNVVGDYLKQIQEECLQMKAAVEANNRTRVIQLAQGLKESGSGYGLDRVSFLGQQIMDQAQNGGGPALLDSIESLSDYLAKVQIVSAHAYTVTVDAELEPVIDDYVRAVKQDCRSLVKALRQRDIDTVAGIGHDLKGSGEGYGLTRVSEIGKALCEHARTKNMSGLVNETKSLAHYIQNVVIVSA